MAAGSDVPLPLKRSRSYSFLPPHMSELRVVILGSGWSQRSSVGNLLLNEAVFDATKEPESPMRQTGELQDKKISVIHCPDLLQPDLTADALSELVTDIADACDPGPHVFLLVLSPEDFTEQQNLRLQSVLRSFSEQSFHHSLVLLTATKETSVMEDYENSLPLDDLIRKCKNRYQWVKSLESHMISEIHKELLTKIVQILKENDGKHVSHDISEDDPPAAQPKEREGGIKKGFKTFKKTLWNSDSVLRIVLFGKSDDKKAKLINFIHHVFGKERPVVVKTPNLFSLPKETVREELKKCVSHCSPGPNVLLLLVNPSNFSENDRKTLTFILSLFGPEAFKHSMVVLTHRGQMIPSVSKLICDCGGRFYNMFDENHKLLTDSLKSIVDQNKSSFLTLTEEQKPSLNLVLFGGSRAEKTSAAESILGRADLPAGIPGQCVKREAEVCGGRVSLVELPPLSDKPLETVMQQCLHCISLCAPEAVHVFILVLPVGSLTDEDKAELKTIQDTLSSRVHQITMILFIHSDPSAPDVLQFVEGDRDIQRLCQSCGGGYFIFNPRDQQQVPELLKYLHRLKIKNKSYTLETLLLAQTEKISAQHKEIEDRYGDLPPDCLRIVLIGKTGNGKSSSGNTILGRKEFLTMFSQISVTKVCKRVKTTVDGRSVAVVDTPGLFDTTMSHDEVFEEMLSCISLLAPGPHVFLLVLQIGRLTEEEKQTLKLIKEAFGKEAQKFTIILFTHGDKLINNEISFQDYIEKHCDSSFKELISKCGNRFHVFNNTDEENRTQVLELLQKIDEMVKENGGNCFTNDMLQEAEAAIKKEMKRIMEEKEEEMRKEREEMERKYQQEMEEIKQNMDKQREEFEKERQQREKELREKEERIKEEKEQQKRELEKREEEEKLQREKWEEKRKTLEEKIRLEQESKEANRRQMEAERDQWDRERKEWWEKRKQEDEERREEMRQIKIEKEQKEKELEEKEEKYKREQEKREKEDIKRKEEAEQQRLEKEQKKIQAKLKEIQLEENRRQMEQERKQWERERNEWWEKRKQEDKERWKQEKRLQKEMRQIRNEKEQKEKELKEKEMKIEEVEREQKKREEEERQRKEREEKQHREWERKRKELEEKIKSTEESKEMFEIKLEENRRQMEQEREQRERERKEWWEKRKQEDEERRQQEKKLQEEMRQIQNEKEQREKELKEKEMATKEVEYECEREQKKREEEERQRKEQEEKQKQEWEQKHKELVEKVKSAELSKEMFEIKLEENRRQMEREREQRERERKEWWEKRKEEDQERRRLENKLQQEMRQIRNEKEQREKELKEKEIMIKNVEYEREREQKKREEEDRQRKEREEKQHREWERKRKELEEKIKSTEEYKEMFELKQEENRKQMEQEREQRERERKEWWEKQKQEDEERRQQEKRLQEEMRQMQNEKQQKEKELKEKEMKLKEVEYEHEREQQKREEEERQRKEEEEKQHQEWEQKHKELEEKVKSEEECKGIFETKLEENRRQMELEREQQERERKEWWEKRNQEEEERKREEERRQKEMEQEIKIYNERLRLDELKLELEEKKRKELEKKHQKEVEEINRNYEEKVRRQAEEHNEFKENYRKEKGEYGIKHQKEISVLVKQLWARPDKLIKMNFLMSKHEKEINELVTKHEEELNKATNEEEKKTKQKEQEEEKETKQKQHEKEISELIEEVNQSYCVIL